MLVMHTVNQLKEAVLGGAKKIAVTGNLFTILSIILQRTVQH